jgi:succinyl-CoA synthetase beta subunit
MDIEEVAHDTPEKIITFSVDPATGVMGRTTAAPWPRRWASGDLAKQAEKLVTQLYTGVRRQGHGHAGDQPADRHEAGPSSSASTPRCRSTRNALYPSPGNRRAARQTEEDAKEIEASKYDLAYIALDGTIGCMVNGAGLAMATLDIIKLYGESRPTSSTSAAALPKEKVTAAFKIITADPNVKGILVNIFGGIMKCDVIAAA